ncbi:MAG TPA: methyl-accepting chemotaxis protein [Spirochaetota bacterium]|nr:methyl-accepting chemotaxis protein [Spirochaetota bacterium]HOL56148.1 methyl-accepting chemotaxis protein [Spirochaetota bacterium]HPP04001.1 methyl-accepting chemotaxis protein [Spirochaetota bacterium]
MNKNKDLSVKRIKFNIFISLFGILFIFLVFSEFFNSFFNIKYDSMNINLISRIKFAFKPMVMVLYVVFSSIIYLRVLTYLNPLFNYIKKGTDYEKARIAAIKIPWMMINFQVFAWGLGTTVYYILRHWQAESGIPFFFGISLKIVSGFISSLYVVFIINLILKKPKEFLKITDIKKGENDKFSRNKDKIAITAACLYIIINFTYIAYYYSSVTERVPLSKFLLITLPFSVIYFVLGILPIYLSKMEYRFQINTLMEELKKLSSSSNSFNNQIFLINFDELGEMAVYVNKVLKRFNELLENIKNTVIKLGEVSISLSSISKQSSSVSNQQAAAIAEIVSTMEDSDRLSKNIGDKASDVLIKTKTMEEFVKKGCLIVDENVKTNYNVKDANQKTIEFIDILNKDIKAIRDVVMIINNIADQVKIIAFNAELEASAAGEAGKNFEIVASEIRRLADNTFNSTSEIKNKIEKIEKAGTKLIDASKEATDLIDKNLSIANNVMEIFKDIQKSSNEAFDSSKKIEETIKMLIMGFEQILQAMKQISEGVSYSADTSKTASDTAFELEKIVDSLKNITSG